MNNESFRSSASKEDLAKALLVTVTNNIASISLSAAVQQVILRCYVRADTNCFKLLWYSVYNAYLYPVLVFNCDAESP